MPIDEWSIYFNYAAAKYPDLFNKKKFDVLNWPDHPSRWSWIYSPDEYNFENYYPELYTEGIFKDNPSVNSEEKIRLKKKEFEPYRQTQDFFQALKPLYEKYNAVHTVLTFKKSNKQLFLFNLPYYFKITQNTWLKIPINYKALNFNENDSIQLVYYLNGDLWHSSDIYTGSKKYFDGVVYFTIDAQPIGKGV